MAEHDAEHSSDHDGSRGKAGGHEPVAADRDGHSGRNRDGFSGGDRDRLGLAQEALAAARAQAQAKGLRPAGSRPRQPVDDSSAADADRPDRGVFGNQDGLDGPRSGTRRREPLRRVRRDDPQPLGAAIEGLLDSEGWTMAAATGSVFGRWAQIVGPELADHTQPEALRDGELTVAADSTAWATQLRLLAAQLVRRLNAELGPGSVQRVKVRGPVTTTRRPGEWRVRGSRGPRDTYG